MGTLYPYQDEGVKFLTVIGKAILADDVGLGKTLQALTAAKLTKPIRVLIVCLKTGKLVWISEIKKWLGDKVEVKMVSGNNAVADIFAPTDFTIINYDMLGTRTYEDEDENGKPYKWTDRRYLDPIASQKWDVIIFDEAHRLKNRKSKAFEAAKLICRKANPSYIFFLTATPLQNKPEEAWPLLHLIDPNKYSSFWRWIGQYCYVHQAWWNRKITVIDEVVNPEELRKELGQYMIRRVKEDVWNEMPTLTYQDYPVELLPEQRKVYDEMHHRMSVEVGGKTIDAVTALAQVTRLKQIAVSPDLLVPCTEGISGINGAKIRALQDILSGIGDQRFVIFSQYARAIYGILPIIHKEYDILVFTGETDWKERASTIERFQDPNSKHRGIMTTTQCGGQSIDLTAASVVIFLDLLWNPQLNYQAVGRVHRAGQTRPVTVINLLAVDTIEDYVQKVLKAKQAMFDQLIPVTRINKIATEYLKQQSSEPTH